MRFAACLLRASSMLVLLPLLSRHFSHPDTISTAVLHVLYTLVCLLLPAPPRCPSGNSARLLGHLPYTTTIIKTRNRNNKNSVPDHLLRSSATKLSYHPLSATRLHPLLTLTACSAPRRRCPRSWRDPFAGGPVFQVVGGASVKDVISWVWGFVRDVRWWQEYT